MMTDLHFGAHPHPVGFVARHPVFGRSTAQALRDQRRLPSIPLRPVINFTFAGLHRTRTVMPMSFVEALHDMEMVEQDLRRWASSVTSCVTCTASVQASQWKCGSGTFSPRRTAIA